MPIPTHDEHGNALLPEDEYNHINLDDSIKLEDLPQRIQDAFWRTAKWMRQLKDMFSLDGVTVHSMGNMTMREYMELHRKGKTMTPDVGPGPATGTPPPAAPPSA